MKNKKIIITGGAGFIGSHLCEVLSKDKSNDITSIDNYSTGLKDNHVSNVKYIEGCTSNIHNIVKFKPDIIYHLGEYSRVEQSFDDIKQVLEFNKNGTCAVIEFARKNKCKIVYAGSSTKFGDDGYGQNASPYAWSKASNIEMFINYGKWFGLNYVITYFYNAYGPREISDGKYATVVAKFLKAKKENKSVNITSPGTQKRNFTHVHDIVSGLVLVGDYGAGDGYGIGCDNDLSIIELCEKIGLKYSLSSPRQGNRISGKLVSKKTKELGWSARIDINDYINSEIKKSG